MTESNFSAIRARLRYESIEEFTEGYARFISAGGMFIPMAPSKLKPIGTTIRFQFLLADGSTALLGEGIVVQVRPPDETNPRAPVGMLIKFNKLSQESKNLVDEVVALKNSGQFADERSDASDPQVDEESEASEPSDDAITAEPPEDPTEEANLQDFLARDQSAASEANETPTTEAPVAEEEAPAAPAPRGPRKLGQTEGGLQILAFDDISDEEARNVELDLGEESDIDEMFAGLFGGDDAADDDALFGDMFGGGDEAAAEEPEALESIEIEPLDSIEVEPADVEAVEADEPVQALSEGSELSEPELEAVDALLGESSASDELAEDEDEDDDADLAELDLVADDDVEEEAVEEEDALEEIDAHDSEIEGADEALDVDELAPGIDDEADAPALEVSSVASEGEDVSDDEGLSDPRDELDVPALDPQEQFADSEPEDDDADGGYEFDLLAGSPDEDSPDDEDSPEVEVGADVEDSRSPNLPELPNVASGEAKAADSEDAEFLDFESSAVELLEGSEVDDLLEEDDEPPSAELQVEDDGPSELESLLGNLEEQPEHDLESLELASSPNIVIDDAQPAEESASEPEDEESLEFLLAVARNEIQEKQASDTSSEKDILDELLGDDAGLPPPPADKPVFSPPTEKPKKGGFLSKLFGKD